MPLGYAIHNILRRVDPVEPGTVAEFTYAELTELVPMGAVREPTATEIALYRLSRPAEPGTVSPVSAPEISGARDELEAKATALGIKFNRNLSDSKLAERIAEAEAEATKPAMTPNLAL